MFIPFFRPAYANIRDVNDLGLHLCAANRHIGVLLYLALGEDNDGILLRSLA